MADAAIDLSRLAQDLSNSGGAPFREVATQLVASAANQVQLYAQQYAPVRTGALRQSIQVSNQGMTAVVSAFTPYDRYVEYGTGTRGEFPGMPITIRPKQAKYLRFQAPDGRWVYTKKVVSKGMAPRPYMRPAAERVVAPFVQAFGDAAVISIVRGPNAPQSLANPRA